MRIFNGTKATLDIPLSGIQRLQVGPKSISGDFLPSNEFLSLLVSSYDYSEVALVVSGPYEINMCSSVPGAAGFVVQSVEEAIERFNPKPVGTKEVTEDIIVEPTPETTPEEIKEEVKEEQEETMIEQPYRDVEMSVEVPEEEVEEEVEEKENPTTPNPAPKKNKKKGKKH